MVTSHIADIAPPTESFELLALMKSILLVDADLVLSKHVATFLRRFRLEVDSVHTFEDGYDYACRKAYTLFLIDLDLGKDHGLLLVRQLRANGITAPILIWTEHEADRFEIRSLDAGADSFISKQTHMDCVIARINAFLRREDWRYGWKPSTERHVCIGPAVLDRVAHTLELGHNKIIKITRKEAHIVDFLHSNRPQVISAREIRKRVWGPSSLQTDDAVHAVIKRLRKKLEGEASLDGLIETFPSRGYRFSQKSESLILSV